MTETLQDDSMDINNAIIIMKAYKELDDRIEQFSKGLEDAIITRRINLKLNSLPSIEIQGVSHLSCW
jgi:centromere/kinetochore protein ZW10